MLRALGALGVVVAAVALLSVLGRPADDASADDAGRPPGPAIHAPDEQPARESGR